MSDLDRVEARLASRSAALRRRRDWRAEAPQHAIAAAAGLPASPSRCAECAGQILAARIEAIPGAIRCVACQREFERTS